MKLLQKGITHIGVGTPGRISALVERGKFFFLHTGFDLETF